MSSTDAAWQHFADAEWAAARDAFATALERDPGDPEALDGHGQSLWWLGERGAAIDRRREAYAAYRRRRDDRGAGRVAVYLAGEHRIDGQDAAAAGWLARAERLLAGMGTVSEAGWLAIEHAKRAEDPAAAERHSRAALDVAHELADADVECMALAQLGRAIVRQGRVEAGVRLLDEAMTVALGGESSDPMACGDACCTTLVVCDGLADLGRAAQWCEEVVAFTERRRFMPVQSWCRGIFGGVLVRAGEWERGEAVLVEGLRRDRRRTGGAALPLAVLAELRLRQGRLEEAEQLLAGLDDEPAAITPLVRLALERGDVALARALLERAVGGGDRAGRGDDPAGRDDDRVDHLAVLRGELALATGELDGAAERLLAVAEWTARDDLRAHAALLAGRVAASSGDRPAAARELADAVARFAALGYPFEEAQARLSLARVQTAHGSPLAVASARAALAVFERLGARGRADQAAAVLRELGAAGRSAVRGDRDELTVRELEVLRLVAAGLSNGAIAERLVIAPKTAEHHVGRVLAKLGVRSRADAAALAVREGL